MNLEERIKNLKKKNKAKQVQGLDALIELVDLLRNERGDLKEILKKDNSKEIIAAISKLEDTFNGIKPPDYNKLVEAVKNVKIIPQVNVTVDYLKNVEKLLKELKQEQDAHDPVDIERILKELQKPKNAIAVRLTKKDEDQFYNAILSVISGGGGGGTTVISDQKDFSLQLDVVGSITFIGKAAVGSATSAPVWQIRKMDESGDPELIITWADGDASFNKIWDDRTSLTYQ